jgi:hypothetical protein
VERLSLNRAEREALTHLNQGGKTLDELAPLIWACSPTHAAWVGSGSPQHEPIAMRQHAREVLRSLTGMGLAEFDGNHWKVTHPGRQRANSFDVAP